ncbi:hypothetical protein [Ascidiimonas aurantiaca]|uniref:hypothetical protein n=1 Tax=Ascidiimonas aurantiaca TaxID=1685432 RepID=UPI0030EB7F6E
MKYYELKLDTKRNGIGSMEQIINVSWSAHVDSKDSLNKQGLFGPVTGNPPLPSAEINKKSKVTDYLNFIAITRDKYLFISEKFYGFLKTYLKHSHQVWDIEIRGEGKPLPYKIFHIDYPEKAFINYKRSSFKLVVYNDGADKDTGTGIQLFSDKHSLEMSRKHHFSLENPFLKPSKLSFNLSEISRQGLDLIRCANTFIAGYYVSENLKNAIEKEGFTGMDFTPVEELSHHYEIEII